MEPAYFEIIKLGNWFLARHNKGNFTPKGLFLGKELESGFKIVWEIWILN
jgi:hypothetical protein